MTVNRTPEQPKEESPDNSVFKVLRYRGINSNVVRQIFVKKDPSDSCSLVLGSVPFFVSAAGIKSLFESFGSKKSVSECVKRGEHPDQGYTSAKVTFLTDKGAETVYNKIEQLNNVVIPQPSELGLGNFIEEYNASLKGFSDELQRAQSIAQSHQEYLVTRKAEAKNKKSKPDEEGWITVTSKDRHVFKSPKLAGIKKKKAKQTSVDNNKSVQLI